MVQSSRSLASAPVRPLRLRLFGWLSLRTPRIPKIDPGSLPDDLRRDLGFAEGRSAPPRHPHWD